MAKYKAIIVDSAGVEKNEIIEAADKMGIYFDVKARGETLVSAEEITHSEKKENPFSTLLNFVRLRDKIVFTHNLGTMLEAGLALSRALTVIEKQTKKKKFKIIVSAINKSISQGKTLSEAMLEYPKVFNQLMTSMIHAGEESGSLAQSLRVVSGQMENSYKLTKKIRGALMYPAVIVIAMIGIGFFMLTNIVPTLSATFKEFDAELPISTQIVIGISDFLKNNFILSIGIIIICVVGIVWAMRTAKGKRIADYLKLRIPVIGPLIKEVNAARTARTMSSLLSSGVDIIVATQITAEVLQNTYYKELLGKVQEKIEKGQPIAEEFSQREDLYPIFVAEMIAVGEETGQLAQMLMNVAVFYEEEVDQKTKDMSSIIEPFLMIFIGLAVGFFAISMIGPIYSLSSSI